MTEERERLRGLGVGRLFVYVPGLAVWIFQPAIAVARAELVISGDYALVGLDYLAAVSLVKLVLSPVRGEEFLPEAPILRRHIPRAAHIRRADRRAELYLVEVD